MKINNIMKQIYFLLLILFVSSCTSLKPTMSGTFTDKRDGHVYKWVKLKNQIWMAQNLDFQTEGVLDATQSKERKDIGNLYFGRYLSKLAPEGWHVPTEGEWQELEISAGMTKEEAEHNGRRGSIAYDFLKDGSTQMNILFTGIDNYKSLNSSHEHVQFWTSTFVLKSLSIRSFWTKENTITKMVLGTSISTSHTAYVRCVKNDTLTTGLTIDYVAKKRK